MIRELSVSLVVKLNELLQSRIVLCIAGYVDCIECSGSGTAGWTADYLTEAGWWPEEEEDCRARTQGLWDTLHSLHHHRHRHSIMLPLEPGCIVSPHCTIAPPGTIHSPHQLIEGRFVLKYIKIEHNSIRVTSHLYAAMLP